MSSPTWKEYADATTSIVLRAAAIEPGERDLHVASGSLGSKHMVDRSAETIRDELPNDLHAVAALARRYYCGSAGLSPCENQPITRAIARQAPTDRHPP